MAGVAIFGAGGLGAVVLDILLQDPAAEVVGFYDDHRRGSLLGLPVLGTAADLGNDPRVGAVILALGDGHAARRKAMAERLQQVGLPAYSAVHPRAAVSRFADVGPGCIICAGVVINPRAVVGSHCVLFSGAVVEHDCLLGANVYLSPHATLGGYVTVGAHSFLGAGCVIAPDVQLGENVTVGAGAVVLASVPDRHVVVGAPARTLRVKEELAYY